MDKCMSLLRMYGRMSITFPCIGAGRLKYPPDALSRIMVDYIRTYLERTKSEYPLTVKICVYEKDQHLIDVSVYCAHFTPSQANVQHIFGKIQGF